MTEPNPKVIYVAGAGRSGSTLLERILARLPGVQPMGEVLHMWQRGVLENQLCGCGEPFRECEFWSQIGQTAFGGWDQLDVARVLELKQTWDRMRRVPRLLWAPDGSAAAIQIREYGSYYRRMYQAAAAVSGASVVIDSSKQPSLPVVLSRAHDTDISVLHLIRDSRGVAYSWTQRVARPEIVASSVDMPRYRPSVMALKWDLHNLAGPVSRKAGMEVWTVRYEDIMRDPEITVDLLARRLGVAMPADLAQELRAGRVILHRDHTAAGNPMRFKVGEVELRVDERWRESMPALSRRTVTALTLPGLLQHHYLGER